MKMDEEALVITKPLFVNTNPFVFPYHDGQCQETHVDQEVVEVGEDAPVDEGNACIVLLQENCQDGTGDQGRGEDESVNSLAEGDVRWGHFVRHEKLLVRRLLTN